MTRPTVLVIDDHGGFRATARRLLEREGWSVVGEAADGQTGLAATAALTPDVVVAGTFVPEVRGARRAASDQLCTGVWSALAAELAIPGPARRVVVADHEPALGYLCLAAFDVPGEPHVVA